MQVADNLPLLVNLNGVLLQPPTYSFESQPALDQAETGFAMYLNAAYTAHLDCRLQEAGPAVRQSGIQGFHILLDNVLRGMIQSHAL